MTAAPITVGTITDHISWTDQIYGRGSREAPIVTFARPERQTDSYTKTALKKVDWKRDYIVQYIPLSTPEPRQPDLVGKLVSLVSIYPKEGRTRDFINPDKTPDWDVERWPDAIMMREVFWFSDPPVLKDILPASSFKAISSDARNRLGEPGPELYEAIKDMEVEPVLDLYRSRTALEYLRTAVEPNPAMQVVANRRTGKAGYVYALSLPEYPGVLKIGSAFDPSVRVCGLSTAVPSDFTIEDAILFEDCRSAELEMHRRLAAVRHRADREWFRCTQAEFRATAATIPGRVTSIA